MRKRLRITHRAVVSHCERRPPEDGAKEFILPESPKVILIMVVLLAILVPDTRKIQESLFHA